MNTYGNGARVRIDLPGDPNYGRVGTIAICDGDTYQVEGLLIAGAPGMSGKTWTGWYHATDLSVVV